MTAEVKGREGSQIQSAGPGSGGEQEGVVWVIADGTWPDGGSRNTAEGGEGNVTCEWAAVNEVRWEMPGVGTRQTAFGRNRGTWRAWSSMCGCLGRPQEGQNQARRAVPAGGGRGLSQRRLPGVMGCPIL